MPHIIAALNAAPASACTLAIPDLLRAHQEQGRPRLPSLERMLARAARRETRHLHGCVAPLFGLAPAAVAEAPFARLADGGTADDSWWLRADPVHLAPDRDQLVLMPQSVLELAHAETQALAEAFNKVFADDGWHLEFPHPLRGYLSCPKPLDVFTHDPAPFMGGPVLAAMPTGPDAARLKLLMNELQMLFHTHAVNSAREEAGRPPINSLWFWGGGRLPPVSGVAPRQVVSDLPLVQGLALWAGREPLMPAGARITGDSLIALAAGDVAALERGWFAPLLAAVKDGTLRHLDMHLGGLGDFTLDRGGARRFWRFGRPMGTS
ncbi:MAG TPA: hypothetical protein VF651_09630 [Gammaproteobacteria bacterium]